MKSNRLPLTIFLLAVVSLNVLAVKKRSAIYNSRLISACRNSPGFKLCSFVHVKKCLLYVNERMQYMKAQQYCEELENPAFLATFKTNYELQLLENIFNGSNLSKNFYPTIWMGLDRLQDQTNYKWIDDGTPYAYFNNLYSTETGPFHCVMYLSSRDLMVPMVCNSDRKFFCEVR